MSISEVFDPNHGLHWPRHCSSPSKCSRGGSPLQIQIYICLTFGQIKWTSHGKIVAITDQKNRCGWKPTCLSPDSPSTSKLPTVNPSKYFHTHTPQWIIVTTTILRVCDLLDYTADDLTGKSMYSLVHAADVHKIKQTHVDCKWWRWL